MLSVSYLVVRICLTKVCVHGAIQAIYCVYLVDIHQLITRIN